MIEPVLFVKYMAEYGDITCFHPTHEKPEGCVALYSQYQVDQLRYETEEWKAKYFDLMERM